MNVKLYLKIALLFASLLLLQCSKNKNSAKPDEPIPTNAQVKQVVTNANNFSYKTYFQEENTAATRKGIIIIAVGDGGTINDATINAQCVALGAKGYVAVTTTYRPMSGDYINWMSTYKEDIESIIGKTTQDYGIARNKVVIGGLSRGGNLTYGLVLPGQMGNTPPINGIRGVILQCAGGDQWKGSAILFPVLFMNNKIDAAVGTADADTFVAGLASNTNPNVKTLSKTLIIPGSGHCGSTEKYTDFIVSNIDKWF